MGIYIGCACFIAAQVLSYVLGRRHGRSVGFVRGYRIATILYSYQTIASMDVPTEHSNATH